MAERLYRKYKIEKADGSPVDPDAVYFVLRLDTDAAAREAALKYAECIRPTQPEFADDIWELVGKCRVLATAKVESGLPWAEWV